MRIVVTSDTHALHNRIENLPSAPEACTAIFDCREETLGNGGHTECLRGKSIENAIAVQVP